jgi:Tol biopolymer transport system component/DNA-binding winged helix-turn-helix (wHTH) protein
MDLSSFFYEFNLSMANDSNKITYCFEEYWLDAARRMLYRGAEEIALPPKAVETLLALIESGGEIVSKDELITRLWSETAVEESNLWHYLYLLRKTLGQTKDGKPFIETLRRRGYRFNAEVQKIENVSPRRREETEEKENYHSTKTQTDEGNNHSIIAGTNVAPITLANESELPARADASKVELFARAEESNAPETRPPTRAVSSKFHREVLLLVAVVSIFFLLAAFFWLKPPGNTARRGDLTILSLTNGEAVFDATVSPDGKYFVYHSPDGNVSHLWLQQVGQSSRVEILPPFRGEISGKTFTPDSKFIYFVAQERSANTASLYRVPTLGGAAAKILTDIASPVSFSPDGKQIVFVRRSGNQTSLIVVASDGNGAEKVLLAPDAGEMSIAIPAWSPDGKQIAFGKLDTQHAAQEGKCAIAAVSVPSGEIKKLSAEKWDNCYRTSWTPDGEGLIFIGTKYQESLTTRRDQIYYISAMDGAARRITSDGSRHQPSSLGITQAGEILAVPFTRYSQIWQMEESGDARTARQITSGQSDGRSGIASLSNGRIAFLTREGEGFALWTMNADGADKKLLTDKELTAEELRVAPDGSFYVFAAKREGHAHLFRLEADGANLKQLTFGDRNEIDSTISPDGAWIFYSSGEIENSRYQVRLWKMPSAGGEAIRVSEQECDTPHFSSDQRKISCVAGNEKVLVLSAANGSLLQSFPAERGAVLNVGARFTPDGESLVYIVNQGGIGNLWRQPLAGGEAKPLTDFTSGSLYNFAYSADGARLYLARGYSTSSAILIKNWR